MFSSGAGSSSLKGLRRKAANDGRSSTLHVARPSTAASAENYYGHNITDLLEPAMDGPPSPEGIRAFSRRVKRGSIAEPQNHEQTTSSGSSSLRSETPETPGERSLENPSLSRNASQRAPAVPFKERPDSVQLFGKAVFGRRPKLRREQSDQSYSSSSLHSLNEAPTSNAPDPSKEQRFIPSMFARRARGTSEVSQRKFQISGPYDFQHVSHSSKANLPSLDDLDRNEPLPNFPGTRSRTTTGASIASGGGYPVDKPLPTPPSPPQDFEHTLLRDSIQLPPPRPPTHVSDDAQVPPIPPLPQASGSAAVRHDRTDSFSTTTISKTEASASLQTQPFRLSSTEGLWPPPTRISNGHSEQHVANSEDKSTRSIPPTDETSWPLTASMTALPEVPEEEECHPNSSTSHTDFMSNRTSLRGSMSVPHLRNISLSKVARRSPSNASDTLGRFDFTAAQRALYELESERVNEDDFMRHSWEDDIDYCYDHAAEASCDFAWERPSCDFEHEDYFAESPIISPMAEPSSNRFGLLLPSHSSTDLPGLSPTSNGSGSTQYGATTPTSSAMLMPSNFSLPKLDTSIPLKRDHDRSLSTASSFQELQGFCLSPSLLIPNDDHEKMLHYDRGDFSGELNLLQHDGPYLKFDRPDAFAHPRSSASTTISTLSEHSIASSRYPSSNFTRWTGSSTSSWQAPSEPQQPVAITLNDKDHVLTPTSDMTVLSPSESSVASLQQEIGRDGRGRAQSDANLLMKMDALHDMDTQLESKTATEPVHRRTRTGSRINTNSPPQFTFFPQGAQRH